MSGVAGFLAAGFFWVVLLWVLGVACWCVLQNRWGAAALLWVVVTPVLLAVSSFGTVQSLLASWGAFLVALVVFTWLRGGEEGSSAEQRLSRSSERSVWTEDDL